MLSNCCLEPISTGVDPVHTLKVMENSANYASQRHNMEIIFHIASTACRAKPLILSPASPPAFTLPPPTLSLFPLPRSAIAVLLSYPCLSSTTSPAMTSSSNFHQLRATLNPNPYPTVPITTPPLRTCPNSFQQGKKVLQESFNALTFF